MKANTANQRHHLKGTFTMGDISRGTMARLGEALDRVGRRMNRATNERLDGLREEVGRHGGRLDELREEMSRHGGALDELRDQVGRQGGALEELRGDISRQGDRVLDRVVEFEIRSRRDIVYAGDQQAGRESNEFARDHLTTARQCEGRIEALRYALSQAPTGAMALEFGVAAGESLRVIVQERGAGQTYGFDSFQGLPESWLSGMPAGTFAQDQLPEVGGAELVVGYFDDVLPQFLEEHPGPVDFLHVDSDLYSSAKTVLQLVGPRLQPGSVVHFDEFFNYPGWQRHEFRAWNEYTEATGLGFEYIAYAFDDCQVAVRIDAVPGS